MKPYFERASGAAKARWRIAYRVAGRRVRLNFPTKAAAERWVRRKERRVKSEGENFENLWSAIADPERHEVMDSLALIRTLREMDGDASLVEATKEYCLRRAAVKKSVTLEQAIQRFLAAKGKQSRKGKLSEGWLYVLQTCLEKIFREIPDNHKSVAEFTTDELELFLDDQDWPPRTFNNYRDYLFGVFKWAMSEGFLSRNPVAKIEKYGKKMLSREVIIPPASFIARVLKLSHKPRYQPVRAAIDLGMGLMMRSSEISRIDWSSIGKDVVRVSTAVGKYGKARNIHRSQLLAPVFQSLMRQHQGTGPVAPKGWRRLLTELFEEAGLGKPRNVMRKSSSSCHFHATGDESLTRENMGHAEDSTIFGEVYKAIDMSEGNKKVPITKKDGEAHFALWKRF